MEPVINSPGGKLAFQASLPKNWKGKILSGSIASYHLGPQLELSLQKFQEEEFHFAYVEGNFSKKLQLSWKEEPLLRIQYILAGSVEYRAENGNIKLKAGQVNAVWAPGRETTATFYKGIFKMFQVAVSSSLVQELLPNFPTVTSFPAEHLKRWIGKSVTDAIDEILGSTYTAETRSFYYKTKSRELLLSYARPVQQQDKYPEHIRTAIHKVDQKILEDATKYYTTKELARLANLSEAKLIEAYKDIVGVSMFERYKEAKLQRAVKYLVETDEQIKVFYKWVGYDSISGFVEAFTKRFGDSPLQYRIKHRPF